MKNSPHCTLYLLLFGSAETGDAFLFLTVLCSALCFRSLNEESQRAHNVEKEATDLLLLLFRGFNLQLLMQVVSGLPHLTLRIRPERTSEFRAHDISELEKGRNEFIGIFDL